MSLLDSVINFEDCNLFSFLHNSIISTCKYLGVQTEIKISSAIDIDHSLKNQEKVIAFCAASGASIYINSIGGVDLYSKSVFSENSIALKFIQSQPFEYNQFSGSFVSGLSIVDVMMFNSVEKIQQAITNSFELI